MVDDLPDEEEVRELVNNTELSDLEIREQLIRIGIENIDEVLNYFRLRPYRLSIPHMLGSPLGEIETVSETRWSNYLEYLREVAASKSYDPREQIKSIQESTDKILPYFRDSMMAGRPTYGLVVGDVQSGKTANFCGLMTRAADSGIPLIIVMSGITNVLRNQTQKRVDDALCRNVASDSNYWRFITNQDREEISRDGKKRIRSGDFTQKSQDNPENNLEDLLDTDRTSVLVIKKRPHTLEKLYEWLSNNRQLIFRRQILFIDDESDSASINNQRNIPEHEVDLDIDQEEATRINRLIRSCIQISEYSIYIGYTATPYAALLSDPWDYSEELGHSLYPRDFIVALPQPTKHNGTVEFFSDYGYLRSKIQVLERQDVNSVNILEPHELPDSLKKSVYDFIITGAIKLRSSENFHHSMLVHCNVRKANHERIEHLIRRFGQNLNREYKRQSFTRKRTETYRKIKSRWENEFDIDESEELEMDIAIKKFLGKFSWMSDVRSINSTEDNGEDAELYEIPNVLDYDAHKDTGLWVIAVGGTILSRGLTVEGLTISYFTREAALYDTLTQMARWYGYHGENSKLIRVRISDQIHRWFRWIYQVESRIRDDIIRYELDPNTNPLMLAPRVLRYAETEPLEWEREQGLTRPRSFQPTRRSAMITAESRGAGFAGTYFSSRYLPLNEPTLLTENINAFSSLVESIERWDEISGGFISRGIEPDKIIHFIDAFNHNRGARTSNSEDVINYIRRRNETDELIYWSVAVMSPGSGSPSDLGREIRTIPTINMTRRGRLPRGSIDEIMDKMHVAADLDGYPGRFQNMPNPRQESLLLRASENGLLILYILDPNYIPDSNSSRGYVSLFDERQQQFEVVAFGLGLPDSETARNEDATEEYYHPRGVPGNV